MKKISFGVNHHDFTVTLNKRVNDYFKANQISKHANAEMVIKTFLMFALYFVPYGLIISGVVTSTLLSIGLVVIMGLGLAGIGLSVMHDGNHRAYSNKDWINNLVGYTLNMVGANSFNWKMQHNVLHHSYTNIHEADEDIDSRGLLRMTPHEKWRWFHRYQYVYAWFVYGLMTIAWMFFKDFERLAKYQRMGLLKRHNASPTKEWTILAITKLVYIGYIFVIPLLLTSWAWWQLLIGITTMHYVTGFLLAIIFQPAHVIEGTEYPMPDANNKLENARAVHQLQTTTNYANNSRIFSWFVGGLNFQVEHHLFPHICHVHYRKISGIVKETAKEFDLPYKSVPTFAHAMGGHLRLLKQLGTRPSESESFG